MRRLRPPILLRGSERVLSTGLLAAAQGLFLWMFLAADPIEVADSSERALTFAADWRHGMAGNSWLYMPGFFATAAATWLFASVRERAFCAALAGAGAVAFLAAVAAAPAGARVAAADYEWLTSVSLTALPRPSPLAAVRGVYTLAVWSVFVLACRSALCGRTARPFIAPAILAVGLILVRPWTVDDFTSLWAHRIAAGDVIACASALAIAAVAALLAASVQRSQSRSSPTCATGMRRAETTNTR